MRGTREFVLAVTIWVEAPVAPSACLTSAAGVPAPLTQNAEPSTEAAPRTLFALKASEIVLEVSMLPAPETRAMTRGTAALVVDATPAVPGTVL